jgi:hypothetical protein
VLIPLVARAGVLAEVDSALAATRAGRGTLLTVTGEPGIGKTRLAEAAAGRAAGCEIAWTWGPCLPVRRSAWAAARPDSRSGCSTASRSACWKRPGPACRMGTAR